MAYTAASVSANEIAWAADDKPLFSGNAAIVYDDMQWVVGNQFATWAASSDDATGFEAYRAVDGLPGRVTKPNAADTAFTFLFDWSTNPITFDWFGLLSHNLYTLSATQLLLQIADDSTFTSPGGRRIDLFNKNISTLYSEDRRLTDLTLGASGTNRYTDVNYGRLSIVCSSGTPYIGQVIFGRRYQQNMAPNIPWDPTNETSTMYEFESPGGVKKRTGKRKGRRELNATFRHQAGWPALSGYSTFETDVDAFWTATRCGKEPFFWIDEPNANPDDFWMFKMLPPAINYPHLDATSREFTLRGSEQGPQAQYFSQGP